MKLTVGAEVYPLPADPRAIDATGPLIAAVAVAPVPPPPVMLTVGADV